MFRYDYTTPLKTVLWIVFISGVLFPLFSQTSQDDCQQQLAESQKMFYEGRFDAAMDLVNHCLETSIPREQRIDAYRLLVEIYLGKSYRDNAKKTARELLELSPNFETNQETHSPALMELLAEVRREMEIEEAKKTEALPPPTSQKKSIKKWLYIGGGAVVTGVVLAVLLNGGEEPTVLPEPPVFP